MPAKTALQTAKSAKIGEVMPVYVAGNSTVHAGRKIGTYESGTPRFAKVCAGNGRANHEPMPCPGNKITCKRCLAKLPAVKTTPKRNGATGPRYTDEQIKRGLAAKKAGKTNREVAEAAGVKSPAYFSKTLKAILAAKPARRVVRSTKKVAA